VTERRTLLRFGPRGPVRRRLFCLPYAGGSPAMYRTWVQDLPDDVEVAAIQLPGRAPGSAELPLDSLDLIVEAVLPAVRDATDVPYALFGHSMGSLIAFELAIALESGGGAPPDALFVSGRRAPNELHTGRYLHDLPEEAFLDAMDARYGGVPAAVRSEPELLALFLPALRADVRTFETYAPLTDAKVRCPVHVYGGADDTHPRPDQLASWQTVAESDVTVRLFPGEHFYVTTARAELVADIARRWALAPLGVARR
jgi:medium-chain acyl-[acyl-carrier-protein] hydrolase